ncbi:MAG: biotin--[acetyl-CoA-carboxylase] ligase [Acidobacteria bacterium]|nr:biotin--[acetyl-CoA-carboxylase] ligase [Acidobacteriota bacterium]
MSDSGLPAPMVDALQKHCHRLGCFAGRVRYLREIRSTNDKAIELALAGASEGTTVVAGAQTAGRGRRGRSWSSPKDAGLYASVVFRQPALSPLMTLMSGVALAEAIRRKTKVTVTLKWPNDLVVKRNVRRKLGGILAEAGLSPTGRAHVVVGFGINLRAVPRPATAPDEVTSIEGECGDVVPLESLLVEVLVSLVAWRETMIAGRTGAILDRWRTLSPSSTAAMVELAGPSGPRRGTTAGIDADGALLVRIDGATERVVAGELRWV